MIKILDFYSEGCAPCVRLKPVLEQFENVEFLNIKEHRETANQYGVRRVPTLIFLKDNKEVQRAVGVVSKQQIDNILESLK